MIARTLASSFAATLCLAALSVLTTRAQEPGSSGRGMDVEHAAVADSTGKSLALLVGVQEYQSVPKLKYCRADVRLLEEVLRKQCRFDKVIVLVDDADDTKMRPTLGNISKQLRIWLKVANSAGYRRVLVYFSGHGYRDKKERLYFAPPDCDRENLELTGLPQSYVKQMLDGCTRVPVKLLVLDCCHAGAGRGDGEGASGEEVAAVFKNAKGLLTLASCCDEEISLEWDDKGHGLFTYWLCEGLKGRANENRDTFVDASELHKYVYNQVLETSATLGSQQEVVFQRSDDWRGEALLARVELPSEVALPDTRPTHAYFTVRQKKDGPVVTDATVELWYRPADSSPPERLSTGTTNSRGELRMPLTLDLFRETRGEYAVVLSRDASRRSLRLPRFPQSNRWTLYLPSPSSPPAGGSEAKPAKEYTNSLGMKFRLIPDGEFMMGSPTTEEGRDDDEGKKGPHRVRITKPFYMGIHEVTQGQWKSVMGTEPWEGEDYVKEGSDYAASYVSWDDAQEFIKKLSIKEGRRYRLPTEAEWEYACRAGSSTSYHFGDDSSDLGDYAWYGGIFGDGNCVDEKYAHRVGQKQPNAWGLYDMHGNVYEWCEDRYSSGYYSESPTDDPTGPSSGASGRVFRGGGWNDDAWYCRAAFRDRYSPGSRSSNLGFRLALVPSD